MLSSNQIKEIRSLKQKKFRQKYDKFVVEGHKTSIEFIKSGAFVIESIFAVEQWINHNQGLIRKYNDVVVPVSPKEMERITLLSTPSEVLLVCHRRDDAVNLALNDLDYGFYLDDLQDPGNVGTILRIADWFGMKYIFFSENTVDQYNPKVVQASRGSMCNVGIIRQDIASLKEANNVTIVGTDMQGEKLADYKWHTPSIIILGKEGSGMTEQSRKAMASMITIPGSDSSIAESLNVASVASIIAYTIKV